MPAYTFQVMNETPAAPWEKPIPLCWSNDSETLLTVPSISDKKGFLYLALSDGAVSAIDSATGKQAWHTTLGGEVEAMKLAENGRIIVVTRQEGELSLAINALSPESGITAWRKDLPLSNKFYLLSKGNGIFYFREEGEITALNSSNGDILWTKNSGGKLTAEPVLTDKSVIVGLAEKKLAEIDLENGKTLQNFTAQGELNGLIAASGGQLIYSDSIGNIFSLRMPDGQPMWKARAGAEVSDISITGQGVLVSSNDNFTYMLTAIRGDRKWKRKFSGRLIGKPVVHENYALFVTSSGTEGVILNLVNGKFVNNVFLLGEAYFTGPSTGILDDFVLSTSQGLLFYSNSCKKK
jgi:outer membrane protein assembly factor BamB